MLTKMEADIPEVICSSVNLLKGMQVSMPTRYFAYLYICFYTKKIMFKDANVTTIYTNLTG